MPWEAIKYVTSGFTLIAFLALAALFVYQHYLRTPERLIRLVEPDKRYGLVEKQLEGQAGTQKFRMTATVLGAIFFVSLFGAISSFQADSSKHQKTEEKKGTDPPPSPPPKQTLPTDTAHIAKPVPLHEVHVSVYDGREQPRFAVDSKPATAGEYESGVASFRLPAGHHEISADYSDRTCTANFLVPAASLIAAQCSLK